MENFIMKQKQYPSFILLLFCENAFHRSSNRRDLAPLQKEESHLSKQSQGRILPQQTESFRKGAFPWEMNWDSEYAAAVAAATFSIYSLEESEANYRRKLRDDFEESRTRMKTTKEDNTTSSLRVTRSSFNIEVKDEGETSSRKAIEQDQRVKETALPSRKPSRSSFMRPVNLIDQRQRGNSTRRDVAETRAGSWEKSQLQKINKRYEKMKSNILAWENAKKMQAKLHMERKKNELEMRKVRNLQHYQNKLARIDLIAGGARGQLEEKKRNEELEAKEKGKSMRLKGKAPMKCFCW